MQFIEWILDNIFLSMWNSKQDQGGTLSWSCLQAVSKPVGHMPSLFVQWKTPDDGQRNCSKQCRVLFQK